MYGTTKDKLSVNARSKDGWVALYTAAQNGRTEEVKALLQAGARIDGQNQDGVTVLMEAALCGHIDVVSTLLQAGAKINIRDNDGWTAFDYAKGQNHNDIVDLLIKELQVRQYRRAKKYKVVKLLVLLGAIIALIISYQLTTNTNQGSNQQQSNVHQYSISIHDAAENGDLAQDKDEWTDLMIASYNGDIEMVKFLLQAGADINMQDEKGWTALMYAALNGHSAIVEALLQSGADINVQNEDGKTALDYAKKWNYIHIVALLTSYKPARKPTNYNEQLLSLASTNKHKEIRKLVLMHEANTNYRDPKTGETVLIKALLAKQYETVKLLVLLGANVNTMSKNKTTPLHIAAHQGHLETVKLLITSGAKKDALDGNGQTAYAIAKASGHADVAALLGGKQGAVGEKEKEQKLAKEILAF